MYWLATSFFNIFLPNLLLFNGLVTENQNMISFIPLNSNIYISSYNEQSFFESRISEQIIDVENIDEELLNATFIFTINKLRNKGRRRTLKPNEELLQTCKNIVTKYSGNTFLRFNKNKKHKKRFKKILKKRAKEANFNGIFIEGKVDYLPLIKIKKKKRYIYDETIDEGKHLFFYKKKKKNYNNKKEFRPIEYHTYQSFIDSFFRYQSNSKIKAKYFSEIGAYIQVVQKSKKKIPYAKIIWVVGGFRLGQL